MKNKKNENSNQFHTPVLINESIDALCVVTGNWYIDATFGFGGHTRKILEKGGNVIGIDQDEVTLRLGKEHFKESIESGRLLLHTINFGELDSVLSAHADKKIAGALFDLGISTYQLKHSGRGISFLGDEPLDMRLSNERAETAAQILNTRSQSELVQIFEHFGEERLARAIAEKIVEERKIAQFERTGQLVEAIEYVYKANRVHERIQPSTRVFQALRIVVNDELTQINKGITAAYEALSREGKIVVISFHSLEDRIVKQSFLKLCERGGKIITKHPIRPTREELIHNKPSRSAKMRVLEKN